MRNEHDANWALVPKANEAWMRPGRGHRRALGGSGCKLFFVTLALALVSACGLVGCGGGGCADDCSEDQPLANIPAPPCAASKACT